MASGIPCTANPQNNNLLFFIWSQACLISSSGLWRYQLRFKKYRYEKFNSPGLLVWYKNVDIPKGSLQIFWHAEAHQAPADDWGSREHVVLTGAYLVILHWLFTQVVPFINSHDAGLCSLGHSGLGHCKGEWTRSSCLLQVGGAGRGPGSTGFPSGRPLCPKTCLSVH